MQWGWGERESGTSARPNPHSLEWVGALWEEATEEGPLASLTGAPLCCLGSLGGGGKAALGLPLLPLRAGLRSAAVRLPRHGGLIWSQSHRLGSWKGPWRVIWPSSHSLTTDASENVTSAAHTQFCPQFLVVQDSQTLSCWDTQFPTPPPGWFSAPPLLPFLSTLTPARGPAPSFTTIPLRI